MAGLGYGGGYRYPHNFEGSYVPERYLPDAIADQRIYQPGESGREQQLTARDAELRALRARDEHTGQVVALKLLRAPNDEDERHLVREAQTLAAHLFQ